jgi:uncharacterized protein
MIVDTSALLAYFDTSEPAHEQVSRAINAATDALVVSPYVIAEVDYLVATRIGVPQELAVLRELAGGAWTLAQLDAAGLQACSEVVQRFADQGIGVADASLVVLADRFRTRAIATLDRRHFSVLRPLTGGEFRLIP